MKKQEVTFKTEVTTMVQEPKVGDVPPVVVSEYGMEQRGMQTQVMQTYVSEQVFRSGVTPCHCDVKSVMLACCWWLSKYQTVLIVICCKCVFQELQISSFEERIIHEIEIRILKITYQEILIEDGEQMVMNVSEQEAVQSSFDTPVKSYRIMEGMGVTFHCKMAGKPLPKVLCSQALSGGRSFETFLIGFMYPYELNNTDLYRI